MNQIVKQLNCQVGGGIRSLATAREILDAGAHRVILGSALLQNGKINTQHAAALESALGAAALVFALDSRGGRVAIEGWRKETAVTAFDMIRELEPFCETFLYTHIDTEGLMGGIPMKTVSAIRQATSRRLAVAGGITTQEEIDRLDALRMDADCRNGSVFRKDFSVRQFKPASSTSAHLRQPSHGLPLRESPFPARHPAV